MGLNIHLWCLQLGTTNFAVVMLSSLKMYSPINYIQYKRWMELQSLKSDAVTEILKPVLFLMDNRG